MIASTSPTDLPARMTNLDALRPRHGDRIERLGPWFNVGDPLADAVVEAFAALPLNEGKQKWITALEKGLEAVPAPPAPLLELLAQAETIPMWLDWDEVERGAAVYRSLGVLAPAVLIAASLPLIYASPAGCKPLTYTGRLVGRAHRRLIETTYFIVTTVGAEGMRPRAAGFKLALHVRLLHAQVRRVLRRSKRWNASWGVPINQVDMLGSNLCFSWVVLDGLRRLGIRLSPREMESVMHLWRYSGYLIGIDPQLQVATMAEGERALDLILSIQAAPDEDSVALTRALLDATPQLLQRSPESRAGQPLVPLFEGLLHRLCGTPLATALRVPRTPWRHATSLLSGSVALGYNLTRACPGGRSLAQHIGSRLWIWSLGARSSLLAVDPNTLKTMT